MNAVVAAYAAQLWPLEPALEALFEDWLPRLRAAFGPWRRPAHSDPLGEPDGYGGLDRRGAWERLLVSEWALAREVPDEFVRRAAGGEQLFLRLDRVMPAASPHTRVWVDCGPTQLGAPRLAHLAILVVFARRAEEAGGGMSWAPAHLPDDWHDALDPMEVLDARTLQRPRIPAMSGDVWAVGGTDLSGPRVVRVSEREGGLDVRVGAVTVALDLPDPGIVAHLLTEPVARITPGLTPPAHGAPMQALAFAAEGGALLGRRGDQVLAWAVPRGPRSKPKVRARDPWSLTLAAEPIVAATWHGRKIAVLRAGPREMTLLLKERLWRMPRPAALQVPGADTLRGMVVLPGNWLGEAAPRTQVLVRDAADVLWSLDFVNSEAVPLGRSMGDPVQSEGWITWLTPAAVWIRYTWGGGTRRSDDALRDHTRVETRAPTGVLGGMVVGSSRTGRHLGLEVDGRWWVAPLLRSPPALHDGTWIGSAERVFGAFPGRPPSLPELAAVYSRDANAVRRVSVGHPDGEVLVRFAGDRIAAATLGGRDVPLVAVATATGQVVILPGLGPTGAAPWLAFQVEP